MNYLSKIYVAGHNGMVGSAILRLLEKQGYTNIIIRTREELDLTNQQSVADFFATEKPEYVILAAAKVGGIMANNTYPADFLYQNLQIQNNVIHNAYLSGVKKLLFLGSSCIYPKNCPQPMKEEYLLTGLLEETNEPYAIAKIAGIKMCQSYNRQYGTNFIAVMPTNLYGENDNFDLNNSHVLPALLRKFHEAKINNLSEVEVWGTGTQRREFLYVDDMTKACLFVLQNFSPTKDQNENGDIFFNIGTGMDLTILELAEMIKKIVGFEGNIVFDTTKPDGTLQKLLDVTKINNLGWKDESSLEEGIKQVYDWYLDRIDT
ncbi:MAG: GDP-L-fucose synthase [Candidatus Magasanikbacteria bacterium]